MYLNINMHILNISIYMNKSVREELWHIHPNDSLSLTNKIVNNEHNFDKKGNSGMIFNKDVPKMGVIEWHKHSDVLLKANAALSMVEYIELISSRVLMMGMCKDILDYVRSNDDHKNDSERYCEEYPYPINTEKLSDKLNYENENHGENLKLIQHKINIQNILEIMPNPSFSELCPRYTRDLVTLEDIALFKLQSKTLIPSSQLHDEKVANEDRISTYHYSSQREINFQNPYSIFYKLNSNSFNYDNISKLRNKETLSVFSYTCEKLLYILNDMILSEPFLLHLSSSILISEGCNDSEQLLLNSTLHNLHLNLQSLYDYILNMCTL